jgi:GTPase SAR1 family protein
MFKKIITFCFVFLFTLSSIVKADFEKVQITFLGEYQCGKTSFINLFTGRGGPAVAWQEKTKFEDNTQVFAFPFEFTFQNLAMNRPYIVTLAMSDSSGQEQYFAYTRAFLRDCDIAVIVVDLKDCGDLNVQKNLETHVSRHVRAIIDNSVHNPPIMIIGAKADLATQNGAGDQTQNLRLYAQNHHYSFMSSRIDDRANLVGDFNLILAATLNTINIANLQRRLVPVVVASRGCC